MRILNVCIFLLALTSFRPVFGAQEPSYCDPNKFSSLEIRPSISNAERLDRLHMFKLGKVTIAGMGIKKSPTPLIESLAESVSPKMKTSNYCTWYFATTNTSAENELNSKPITPMQELSIDNAPSTFMNVLETSFFKEPISFLSCAANYGYIGMGCNDQAHRGPTVWGMVLAFSGCTPEHANTIATKIWGLNGIPAEMRLNVIKAAYEYGNLNPLEREKFTSLLK